MSCQSCLANDACLSERICGTAVAQILSEKQVTLRTSLGAGDTTEIFRYTCLAIKHGRWEALHGKVKS